MSDVETHHVQQVIVPSYVWEDNAQRAAVLTRMGAGLARVGAQVDVDRATVAPHFLKAVVGRAQVADDMVAFVAYEQCGEADADLVMIVLDAPEVES